jgi:hypothetical protein
MPSLADYIIQANPFTLNPGVVAIQNITFSLPAGLNVGARALLFYKVEPVNASGVDWEVVINGT